MSSLLLLAAPTLATSAPSLRFLPPSALPADHGAFADSVQGFGLRGGPDALGFGSGFFGTHNGGKTWVVPALDPGQNDTTFAVLAADGKTLHNLGGVVGAAAAAVAAKGNITSISSKGSTNFSVAGGKFVATATGATISVGGIPPPGIKALRTGGADWLRLPDGNLIASLIVTWGTTRGKQASIAAFRSSDGGYSWTFAADIARGDDPTSASFIASNEGPNENSLALTTNGSLLCVMRLDAGDAGRYHRYARSVSNTGGRSWSRPAMLNGVGAARPRLLRLGGSLLLSGGRTWRKNRDTLVWLNAAGDGELWLPHSISYWHNSLVPNGTKKFSPVGVNGSSHWPRESNSYTSLVSLTISGASFVPSSTMVVRQVQIGPSRAFVTYSFEGAFGFAMPLELVESREAGQ